jgi:ceramide glucosyltransferase
VLKPLAGADPDLEQNLESFFRQDHPSFEILLGVEDPLDPAIAVAERVIARHPEVEARLVVHRGTGATNPKVSNLGGILPLARHELVLISDSNVRVPRGYLRDLAETIERTGAGLVSSLFAGTGGRSLGAALERAQLNGFVAHGVAAPALLGEPVVVGKSMLLRKSVFLRLGGLDTVKNVLGEDYVIGKMFQHGGWPVRLAPMVIDNVIGEISLRAFWRRHLRWSMLRFRLHPLGFVLEPLASPLALLPLALMALGAWGWVWALAVLALRDAGGWVSLRGWRGSWQPLLLAPLREALALAIWVTTFFVRHVSWRGHQVRIGAGTLAYVADPLPAAHPERA